MTQEELLALIDQAASEGWTELDLSGQNLTELPPEIGKLAQLEILILGKWEKGKKGPQGFEGYEHVDGQILPLIVTNELTSLPPELENLQSLRKLDLSGNAWHELPDIVSRISSLEELISIRADLKEIPEAIAQLEQPSPAQPLRQPISEIPDVIAL